MRKRTAFLGLAAITCLSLLAASPADAARRDGLQGNELIRDEDDVFLYPQLAVDYADLLSVEFGGNAATGNATMLVGGEGFAGGVAIHRGDLFGMSGFRGGAAPLDDALDPNAPAASLSPTDFHLTPTNAFPYLASGDIEVEDPQSPLSNAGRFQGLHTMFDLLAGADLGPGKAGARLSLGVGGQSNNPPDDDASSEGELSILFRGGYSQSFGDTELDTALSFVFNTGDNNELASGTDSTGNVFGLGLEGRLYSELSDEASLGALLDAGTSSMDITTQSGDEPTESLSAFVLQAGVGPVFSVGDEQEDSRARLAQMYGSDPDFEGDESSSSETGTNEDDATDANRPSSSNRQRTRAGSTDDEAFTQSAHIAGYGVVGFSSLNQDPSDQSQNDEISASATLVPGFHLAGEYHVLEWLYLRTGAQYWFAHFSTRRESADGPDDWGFDNHQFGWSAGLGIEVGQFRFDGSFNRGFLRAGPEFLGGDADGLFSSVSAQYAW